MTTITHNVGGALTGTTVTASTQFSGPGTGITAVPAATGISGQVAIGSGGTGQATAAAAFAALSPQTTAGDLIGFTSVPVRVPVGADGQQLCANSGATASLAWLTSNLPLSGVGISASVAGNALTISLTQADGASSLSANAPAAISFRSTSVTGGSTSVAFVTSSLSARITIPSGTTIGTVNGDTRFIYVYGMFGGGSVVLAVSLAPFPLDTIQTSTAISGGASATTLYTTSVQNNEVIQYIGKILAPQSTAGTWASNPTEIFVSTGYDYGGGVRPINTSTTLTGNGTQVSNLDLAAVGTAATSYGAGFTLNTTGQITAALVVGSAFGIQFQQVQSIPNNTTTVILANSLTSGANFRQVTAPTVSSFNTATGVYTCGQDGVYLCACYAAMGSITTGNTNVAIFKTDALATNASEGQQVSTDLAGAGNSSATVCKAVFCKINDTLHFVIVQNTGVASNGVFVVTIDLISTAA